MAEKKATKAAATKTTAAKEAAPKAAPAKKACATKKAAAKPAAKAATVAINSENVGFKAGDVYQTLAKAEKAMTVAEIAKQAKISTEETLLGLGWLFKEGKVKDVENAIVLA